MNTRTFLTSLVMFSLITLCFDVDQITFDVMYYSDNQNQTSLDLRHEDSQLILVADQMENPRRINDKSGLFYLYTLDVEGRKRPFSPLLLSRAEISPNGNFVFAFDEDFDIVFFDKNGEILTRYVLTESDQDIFF